MAILRPDSELFDTSSFRNTDGGTSGFRVLESVAPHNLERGITGKLTGEDMVVCHCDGTAKEVRACMARNADTRTFPEYGGSGGAIINEVVRSCAQAGHRRLERMTNREDKR